MGFCWWIRMRIWDIALGCVWAPGAELPVKFPPNPIILSYWGKPCCCSALSGPWSSRRFLRKCRSSGTPGPCRPTRAALEWIKSGPWRGGSTAGGIVLLKMRACSLEWWRDAISLKYRVLLWEVTSSFAAGPESRQFWWSPLYSLAVVVAKAFSLYKPSEAVPLKRECLGCHWMS